MKTPETLIHLSKKSLSYRSSRRKEARIKIRNPKSEIRNRQRLLTSAATRRILAVALLFSALAALTPHAHAQGGVPLLTNLDYNGAQAYALAVDTNGNVFVTGESVTIGYSSTGVPLWTNRYTSVGAAAIAVDGSGNVFVTGSSGTVAYSGAGVPLWTNAIDMEGAALAADRSCNVFVTGHSPGNIPPDWDYVTIAYSSAGVPLWTNRYNGTGNGDDTARAVAVDSRGNVFVTGSSIGTTYPDHDYATLAHSSAGVPLWTNRYSRFGDDIAYAIAVDYGGNVFVTGTAGLAAYVTIKYSAIVPPIRLAIEPDGGGGFFIRFTGVPDASYRLQRAPSLTGPWTTSAAQTAPDSGLVEFWDLFPPAGHAFYRAMQQ